MGITLAERLTNDFPKVLEYRNTLGQLYDQLALDYIKVERNEDAIKEFRRSAAEFQKLAADAPKVVEHRALLGTSYLNQGGVLVLLNRLREAETAYKESLGYRRVLAKELPRNMDYQNDLADSLDNLANVLLKRKETNEVLKLLEEAVPYHQAASKSNPKNPSYKEGVKGNEGWHGEAYAQLGQYTKAAAAAEKFTQLAMKPDQDFRDAASIFARSAVLAQQDSKLPQAKREELAQSYSSRAMDALQRVIKAGFKDVKQLNQDPDFEGIRGRDDFRKLTSGN
jgi:tetratricopeptide (TPR) repeat protein